MKNTKAYALFAIVTLATFFGIFLVKKEDLIQIISGKQAYSRDHFINQLDQEYVQINNFQQCLNAELQEIQKQLSSLGATQKKLTEMRTKYYGNYLKNDVPRTTAKILPKTEQFVRSVIQQCGLDDKSISIVPWNNSSPAAATEHIVYINEQKLEELSQPAKLFVVGHEIQHILYQDHSTSNFINHILDASPEELADNGNFEHPLCQYSRFIEKRADIDAALKGKEWAEGYLAFSQERLKKYGDKPNGTHPRRSERVALAQKIIDYHNQVQII